MSDVTTSSLSLSWSLRNWVILDYEEANGQMKRPWAPFFLSYWCSVVLFMACWNPLSWQVKALQVMDFCSPLTRRKERLMAITWGVWRWHEILYPLTVRPLHHHVEGKNIRCSGYLARKKDIISMLEEVFMVVTCQAVTKKIYAWRLHPKTSKHGKGMLEVSWLAVELR